MSKTGVSAPVSWLKVVTQQNTNSTNAAGVGVTSNNDKKSDTKNHNNNKNTHNGSNNNANQYHHNKKTPPYGAHRTHHPAEGHNNNNNNNNNHHGGRTSGNRSAHNTPKQAIPSPVQLPPPYVSHQPAPMQLPAHTAANSNTKTNTGSTTITNTSKSSPSLLPSPDQNKLDPSARPFIPGAIYTLSTLRALRESTMTQLRVQGWTTHGPFERIPICIAQLMASCPRFAEFLDLEAATAIMDGTHKATSHVSPSQVSPDLPPQQPPARNHAVGAANTTTTPSEEVAVSDLVEETRKRLLMSRNGSFLSQKGSVVTGLLLLELTFRYCRSSMKLRQAGEKYPETIRLVRDYLCGEGFHISPPSITQHEQWTALMERLRFDWIRDNKTRIFTELSKTWKKSHTPFEQFVHFFFFREARPAVEVKGMLTHSQKPVMVAALSGDLDAVVLLCELGFYVPPDYFWNFFGFTNNAMGGTGEWQLQELRKVLMYYYDRQQAAHLVVQSTGYQNGTGGTLARSLSARASPMWRPMPSVTAPMTPPMQPVSSPAMVAAAAASSAITHRDPSNPWGTNAAAKVTAALKQQQQQGTASIPGTPPLAPKKGAPGTPPLAPRK